jgi:hypothetical protein
MDTAKPLSPSVVYPETDHMGEPEVQFHIAVRLVPLLVSWLAQRGVRARVGGNQFWYRVEGDARACRAPDVYLVEGVAPDARDRGVWKTWEGHSPAFALEVVSDDRKKDYTDAPADYDAMGTRELVLFDPSATPRSRKRLRWQVFRRVRGHGFVRVFAGNGDRVESAVLGLLDSPRRRGWQRPPATRHRPPRRHPRTHRRRARRRRAPRQRSSPRREGRGTRREGRGARPRGGRRG